MHHNQFALLKTRRFLPLFITQFLGAFDDNVFKNGLVILITYVLAERANLNAQILVTLAAGIFVFPFFIFSGTAGQLADKYDKARLIRLIKLAEIALMVAATLAFYLQSVTFLMMVLFFMGTQSTFFGPLKYGILPDHLDEDELIGGNALVSGGTFLAILLGTTLSGLLILKEGGIVMVSTMIVGIAVLGWISSLSIPRTHPAVPKLRMNYNIAKETWNILAYTAGRRDIFLCILGISWFWLIGATFLAQFPTFAKDVIGGNEQVVTLLLVVFAIGIGIGSLMCNRLLKGQVHATYVPLGALGVTLFTVDLFFASGHPISSAPGELMGFGAFLSSAANWRIVIDLLLIAISGGLYVVPLNTILQARSEQSRRARNIAGNKRNRLGSPDLPSDAGRQPTTR